MEHHDVIKLEDLDDDDFVYHSPSRQAQAPLAKRRKRPSVSTTWAHSTINDLIMAVEEHPCVWTYSCPEYKDRHKREQAWREIKAKCPGHTLDDCKAKWANIKTAFLNVKKKMKAKYGEEAENLEPHWSHWNAMQFFNLHISNAQEPRRTPSPSQTSSLRDEAKTSLDETTNSAYPEAAVIEKDDSIQRSHHLSPFPDTQKFPLPETANSCLPETTNSCYSDANIRNKAGILQRAMKCLEAEEDNWHVIGMYLASQMREIAKKNKRSANKLHLQLIKVAMEATVEAEDDDSTSMED